MDIKGLYREFQSSRGISIDSRTIESGQLFFAIKGEHFDGNRYALQAIKAGATLAVVDDPSLQGNTRVLYVRDALDTLQRLARHHRQLLKGTVIAITGSNGKTTSKELTQSILSTQYRSYATKGNLNNHIGMPLTLLSMPLELDFAVIEMGDNQPGEIAMLSNIALPDYGVVTNVGKDHLGGFGSWQGVYNARKELFDHLRAHHKPAFVNTDIPYLVEMAEGVEQVIAYGTGADMQCRYELLRAEPFVQMKMYTSDGAHTIQSQLFGSYNFENMMLAATIGQYFQVSIKNLISAIERYQPGNNRSQIVEWRGNRMLMDAYNANPSNMEAALKSFAALQVERKVVILGDMLELGDLALYEHQRIAELALSLEFDNVILVGHHFEPVARKSGIRHFDDVQALKEWAIGNLPRGSWIMVKGSRKISLEKLID
jgi:UDP-N-acetylmuramoyl-tripeptide--D-alanyl-D-alanine ligase